MDVISSKFSIYFVLIIFCVLNEVACQLKPSPCPDMFRYLPKNPSEANRWYGELNVVSDVDLIDGVFMVLILDKPTVKLGSSFGNEVIKKGAKEYLLRNFGYQLKAGKSLKIQIFVDYDPFGEPPNFEGFRLNAVPWCPSLPKTTTPITFKVSEDLTPLSFPEQNQNSKQNNNKNNQNQPTNNRFAEKESELEQKDFLDSLIKEVGFVIPEKVPSNNENQQKSGDQCGLAGDINFNQRLAQKGELPWQANIFQTSVGGSRQYFICSGTIISQRHVLTAAHCLRNVRKSDLMVTLGSEELFEQYDQVQNRYVDKIDIHEDYNAENDLVNNIAILTLAQPVQITKHVRPICLWSQSTDFQAVKDKTGIVPGYGLLDVNNLSPNLMKSQVAVEPNKKCLSWYFNNPDFLDGKIICGKYKNGINACNNDPGDGLVFRRKISDNFYIWELKGVLSFTLSEKCSPSSTLIFTDVSRYITWVINKMNNF